MAKGPFQWVNLRQSPGISQDDRPECVIELELADVAGIGLRKEWISIRQTLAAPLSLDQQQAVIEVLKRARSALDKQIKAIQRSS